MKKHDVSYHDHDDSISFYSDHCSYLEASNYSYSNKSNRIQTKKKDFFSKEILSDQSEIIEDKEIKFFLEKTNNSKMILKRTTSIEFSEKLNERSKRLIERRMNES
jgi:vacuolar-type H+-ATPase subunit C/Vma6